MRAGQHTSRMASVLGCMDRTSDIYHEQAHIPGWVPGELLKKQAASVSEQGQLLQGSQWVLGGLGEGLTLSDLPLGKSLECPQECPGHQGYFLEGGQGAGTRQ